jgi:hypothetical protein
VLTPLPFSAMITQTMLSAPFCGVSVPPKSAISVNYHCKNLRCQYVLLRFCQ